MLGNTLGLLGGGAGTFLGGTLGKGIGSAFGPLGTWLGGAGGSFLGNQAGGYLGNMLGDYIAPSQKTNSMPSMRNNQLSSVNAPFLDKIQNAQQGLISQLQQRPQFQPVDINPILQQTQRQYEQEILPSIANRFSSGGLQNSSAFRNALSSSGVDLAQRLASMRTQNEQNNNAQRLQYEGLSNNRLGMLGSLLGDQSRLAQQGSQFGQEFDRSSWDPYLKLGSLGVPLATGLLGAWSGIQQGQNNLQNQKTNAEAQLGAGQLGQQWSPVQHQKQQGFYDYLPALFNAFPQLALQYAGLRK